MTRTMALNRQAVRSAADLDSGTSQISDTVIKALGSASIRRIDLNLRSEILKILKLPLPSD